MMNMRKLVTSIASLALVLAMVAAPVQSSADSGAATYDYIIGSALGGGPAIAIAENGDTVEIDGAGVLSIHPKSVAGGGTFIHMDPSGAVVAEGTWTADKLISFDGYGCGGDGFPDAFCGGRAIIGVTLYIGETPIAKGVLQVDCLIGDKIPASATEGVRLNVKDLLNFNEEVSGFTVLILED